MFNPSEILNYENYAALAVSVYGPQLVSPEIAFEKMGMNIFVEAGIKEKYRWTLYGPKLWRDMEALREIGFSWVDIGNYFSLTASTARTVHWRAKKKWRNKNET